MQGMRMHARFINGQPAENRRPITHPASASGHPQRIQWHTSQSPPHPLCTLLPALLHELQQAPASGQALKRGTQLSGARERPAGVELDHAPPSFRSVRERRATAGIGAPCFTGLDESSLRSDGWISNVRLGCSATSASLLCLLCCHRLLAKLV